MSLPVFWRRLLIKCDFVDSVMVKFISLSSGSNGNCYYIGDENTAFLIDAGIGPRTIKKRLLEHGIAMESIKFVLVSHDHIDHIKSLGVLADRVNLPVYATERLHRSLSVHFCTRGKLGGCARKTVLDEAFEYDGVKITPFEVPHDATETVGYHIDFHGVKFTFITDVGAITDNVINYSSMANVLIIESNYDLDMLLQGGYTPELKLRIAKGNGHLSNEQCASVIRRVCHPQMDSIFLCHLSENNNTPELAFKEIDKALKSKNSSAKLFTLPRRMSSQVFTFKKP